MEKEVVKNPFLNNLGKERSDFEKAWIELTNDIGSNVLEFFQKGIKEKFSLEQLMGIKKLTVIIDNNFLFNFIRGLAENRKEDGSYPPVEESFIYRFFDSAFIEVFAPPKLEEEVFKKIEEKISPDNISQAKTYANVLLSKINITEAQWVDQWIKASRKIRDDDPDDIDYLALAFYKEGHAIISDDKIYKEKGAYESWSVLETKEVLFRCNSGIVAFSVFGISAAAIITLIKLLIVALRYILEFIVNLVVMFYRFVFSIISKIPMHLSLLFISGVVIWGAFFKDGKKFFSEEIPKTPEKLGSFINGISENFEEQRQLFIEIRELLKDSGNEFYKVIEFLLNEYDAMEKQFAEIETERVKWNSDGIG